MKKLLFITNRNVLTTSGELRLIKNRAEALYSLYGIATDFWVWQKKERIQSTKKERINAGGSMKTFVLSTSNPLATAHSFLKMKSELRNILKDDAYSTVILSGSGLAKMAKIVKKHSRCHVVFDVHGSSEDIVELTKKMSFKRRIVSKIIYRLETRAFQKYFKYADGCFVVTNALADYLVDRYPTAKNVRFYIVPCATDTIGFDKNEYSECRRRYRKEFGFRDDDIVLIYSGGVSSWQCIRETIDLSRILNEKSGKKVKLCMFSHQIEHIKNLTNNDDRIIYGSYKPEELKKVLHCGDYAIMLRQNCVTNNVAFPNKFLEYVASGMGIISTPFVFDVADQIEKNKLGFLFNGNYATLVEFISNRNNVNGLSNVDGIDKTLLNNSFLVTLKPFVNELER